MFRACLSSAAIAAIYVAACASPYANEDAPSLGPDGGGPDVAAPPAGCDATKSPKDSPACVDDTFGVFVSPFGNDAARGTKAAPVQTIARGLDLAFAAGLPRVYVCEGTFLTAAEIKSPIAVYGGFTCAWVYSGAKPTIAPARGIALRITAATGFVRVEDLAIDGAADPAISGESAIAVFVSSLANVTLRNVALTAHDGANAAKGPDRANFVATSAAPGGPATGATGGVGPVCTCGDSTTSTGGHGAAGNGSGITSGSSLPGVGASNVGSSSLVGCNTGQKGANGLAGGVVPPTASAGTLSATGWNNSTNATGPVDAPNAPNGRPAQGGGGGGAQTTPMNAGGGGGCGGCGGAGGARGPNGGSSFALLVFNSSVGVEGGAQSTLTSGKGGTGGAGGDGQAGQAGGGGGSAMVCNGGAGGNGAGGSGGAGGVGGHSSPVAFVGKPPRFSEARVVTGAAGAGGVAGLAGTAAIGIGTGAPGDPGVAGPAGTSASSLEL